MKTRRDGATADARDWRVLGWWAGVLAALWIPIWWRLSEVWRLDPEMRHGWFVPPLVAYFAWERRHQGPVARPRASGWWRGLLVVTLVIFAAGLLVWEANPGWPRLMWFMTGVAGIATLAVVGSIGGIPAVKFWAGAVGLLFFALPWPTMVQLPLTLGLATMNAEVAAEVVSAMGYPAAVHGRVIEVGAGIAGVEEACSGIRSLQTVTMVAVFLAAFFRLGWRRGGGLLVAGWAVAILGNLIRTCLLIRVLAREGTDAMNALHDPAGNAVLGATLAIMGVIAYVLPEGPPLPRVARLRSGALVGRWRSLGGVAAAVVLIEIAIWGWYSAGEVHTQRVGWEWSERDDWQPAAVPAVAEEMLGYSVGSGRYWSGDNENPAVLAFLFRWDGDLSQAGGAAIHDPTLCLPGIGSELIGRLPPLRRAIPGGEIDLQGYRFLTRGGRSQFVFFQVWDAFTAQEWGAEGELTASRWQRVADRRRDADIFQIFVVFEGDMSGDRARVIGGRVFGSIMRPVLDAEN
jgi:exosortase